MLRPNGWLLLCPFPWFVYSTLLNFLKIVTTEHLLVFSGSLILAASILISSVIVACILPWLPIKTSLG